MNEPIVVHKLDAGGEETWSYEGVLLIQTETSLTLEAHFDQEDMHFQGLDLRKGDRFVEIYYSDRWYNVMALFDVESSNFKGWYCNITRPARFEAGHVYYEDLALDLIVFPNGEWLVLDDEQYAELNLTFDEHQNALHALEELKTLVLRREAPFQSLNNHASAK
ncbi:MAG: DUF402 domain-containing protein [Anaerolineales bacterium]|jgi:protein associated with RNAse G/E